MRKILSAVLILALLLVTVPTYAAEQSTTVDLTVLAPIFSVTVPTSLPITLLATGEVKVATGASITNNSAGPVKITAIATAGSNGWQTVDYTAFDINTAKVNSKNVGLLLQVAETIVKTTGIDSNDYATQIVLQKGVTKALIYDAKVPAQSIALTNTQIASVIFTLAWDD